MTNMFVFIVMLHVRPQVGLIVEQFTAKFTRNIFTFQMDNVSVGLQVGLQVELSAAVFEITVIFEFTKITICEFLK